MKKMITETYSPNGMRIVVCEDSNPRNVQLAHKSIIAYERELEEEAKAREERRKQKEAERAEREAKKAAKAAAAKAAEVKAS